MTFYVFPESVWTLDLVLLQASCNNTAAKA